MTAEDIEALRAEIKARFGSLYAFIKGRPGGLGRGTFYQVLAGRYGGDVARQAGRIRAALIQTPPGQAPLGQTPPNIFDALKEVACGRCRRARPKLGQCRRCEALWRAQAAALREGGFGG